MERGCSFIVRLRSDACWGVEEELPVDELARQAGGFWQAWVRLGKAGQGPRVRVVRILGQEEQLFLATNLTEAEMSAELVSHCYRQRWQVELFFRWLKHIMGPRHWMAESRNGVSVQIYLTLIAAQLLQLFSGARPNKRALELLQFLALGWATPAEVVALLV
jgi:IS4 transposase